MVITLPPLWVKILLPLASVQLQPSEHSESPAKGVTALGASESLGSTEAKQADLQEKLLRCALLRRETPEKIKMMQRHDFQVSHALSIARTNKQTKSPFALS